LSSVIVILLWIFYSSSALLYSVEVMYVLHSGQFKGWHFSCIPMRWPWSIHHFRRVHRGWNGQRLLQNQGNSTCSQEGHPSQRSHTFYWSRTEK
jgi:uncharacterized BrkB/YihY/UPF0761 family membrane protein